MEEIKVGEYVRTIYGEITRLKKGRTASGSYYYPETKIFDGQEICNHISNRIIAKHSKNIIDLIEVGDYVNGEKVDTVFIDGIIYYDKLRIHTTEYNDYFEEDIKSIVTKEQFASMEYKVGE